MIFVEICVCGYSYCKQKFIGKGGYGIMERIWGLKPAGLVFESWFWLCGCWMSQSEPPFFSYKNGDNLYKISRLCRVVTKMRDDEYNAKCLVHSRR